MAERAFPLMQCTVDTYYEYVTSNKRTCNVLMHSRKPASAKMEEYSGSLFIISHLTLYLMQFSWSIFSGKCKF